MPTVSIDGKSEVFTLKNNEIILDALQTQGFELPHGCLAGACGACRIQILEGVSNLAEASIIEANTINSLKDLYPIDNIRLSCRAKVIGNIKIKILNN